MKQDYECHITVEADEEYLNFLENMGSYAGWKTSFVSGDPDLGKGNRFFFTRHFSTLEQSCWETNRLAALIQQYQIPVVRKKIELVVKDTKNGTWVEDCG